MSEISLPYLHDYLHKIVQDINTELWQWLFYLLLGTGIFFTTITGFVQLRLFGRSVREMLIGRKSAEHASGITPFQAFATGLASRVGVGNIGGVAIAVASGGAGAVFWMWVTALIGMSSAFAESSLAQLFKIRDYKSGQFRGGPAYYITQGLKQRWLGVLFSISLICCFGLVYNAVQSNSIAASVPEAWAWNKHFVGVALVILCAPIIFGGIRRVSLVAEKLVPTMALLYLLLAVLIIMTNLASIPAVLARIFQGAFEFKAVGGGLLGSFISKTMMIGIQRGLYSNEAGQGSAPNAAAAADVKHPVSQGMIQMLGVFVDTIIVCSCTAFVLLLSDVTQHSQLRGVQLTQAAIVSHVGAWGEIFLAVILFMFSFSTIVGNYAYAESNIQFIKNNRLVLLIFRLCVLAMVYFGTVAKVALVWDMADVTMGIMAFINLMAILALSPFILILLKDYLAKMKQGEAEPEFKISEHPKLQHVIRSDVWK